MKSVRGDLITLLKVSYRLMPVLEALPNKYRTLRLDFHSLVVSRFNEKWPWRDLLSTPYTKALKSQTSYNFLWERKCLVTFIFNIEFIFGAADYTKEYGSETIVFFTQKFLKRKNASMQCNFSFWWTLPIIVRGSIQKQWKQKCNMHTTN